VKGRLPSGARAAGDRRGVTLVELVVVLAMLAVLAAITVPMLGSGGGSASVSRAARCLAACLRLAQACAQDGECRMRVVLAAGPSIAIDRRRDGAWVHESVAALGAIKCTTNYPGGAVEFDSAGLPLAASTGASRAGTFTISRGACERAVVVQLTGRVRIR